MANADKQRMEARRAALAAHLFAAQCTFAPEINSKSRRMAGATPLEVGLVCFSGLGGLGG